jgi:hypothetical protein
MNGSYVVSVDPAIPRQEKQTSRMYCERGRYTWHELYVVYNTVTEVLHKG